MTTNQGTVVDEELDADEYEEEGPPPRELPVFTAPDEYESVGGNVLGYYEPEESGAIEFVMTGVRLLDNTQDKNKSSALILAELIKPARLQVNSPDKSEQVIREFAVGTSFGIWAKAGMKDLAKLQGARIWMALTGYQKMKDTGRKKNPMALFGIKKSKNGPPGQILTLLEDARVESLTEAAKTKNPPWHLLVLGEDHGRKRAVELLKKELENN